MPGKTQGFNTGVFLLKLNKLRQSKKYNEMLSDEAVTALANKYHVNTATYIKYMTWY